MLNLKPKSTDTLDNRRLAVLSKLTEKRPFTITWVNKKLTDMLGEKGFQLTLSPAEYSITIKVKPALEHRHSDIQNILRRIAPANIDIQLGIFYTLHSQLSGTKHSQLTTNNYLEIRENV